MHRFLGSFIAFTLSCSLIAADLAAADPIVLWDDEVYREYFVYPTVIADPSGNIYVSGDFNTDTDPGGFFFARYDTTGNQEWLNTYDRSGSQEIGEILCFDASGNPYVAGESSADPFLMRLDPSNGEIYWAESYNGPDGDNRWHDAVADASGYVFVAGRIGNGGSGSETAIAKYRASDGQFQWIRTADPVGTVDSRFTQIALAPDGDLVVTGNTSYDISGDFVTMKYDAATGAKEWVSFAIYDAPGARQAETGLAVASDGSIYVSGWADSGASPDVDFVLVKYAADGTEQWAEYYDYGLNRDDFARDLQVDSAGNLILTGETQADEEGFTDGLLAVKFDPSGTVLWDSVWAFPGDPDQDVWGGASAIGPDDTVYVGGGLSGGYGYAEYHATVAFDTDGDQLWTHAQADPTGLCDGSLATVAVNANGDVIRSGNTYYGFYTDAAAYVYALSDAGCDGCEIGGTCYADADLNPLNDCEECDPATSTTNWTASAAGTSCDDDLFCTANDTCSGGMCAGADSPCPDGWFCSEGSEQCFEDELTPIDLVAFDAEADESSVLLTWETATERDMAGFHLVRSRVEAGGYERVTGAIIPAEGDEFTGASYEFIDDTVDEGTYYYKLEAVDLTGASEFFGPVDVIVAAEPEFGCGMATSGTGTGLLVLLLLAAAGYLVLRRWRIPAQPIVVGLFVLSIFFAAGAQAAETVVEQWAREVGSESHKVEIDPFGNAIVLHNNDDIRKFDPSGNLLWSMLNLGRLQTVDSSGNFVTTRASTTVYKYDSDANLLWSSAFPAYPRFAVADPSGNTYVTGVLDGQYVTGKFDAEGNLLWDSAFDDGYGLPYSIDINAAGSSVVTGMGSGTIGTVRYDVDGEEMWSQTLPLDLVVPDNELSAGFDASGNTYLVTECIVVGTRRGFREVKYDTAGNKLWDYCHFDVGDWTRTQNASVVTDIGEVIVVGTVGFLDDSTKLDYVTVKFDPDGDVLWEQRYTSGIDIAHAVVLDAYGNIYVAGIATNSYDSTDVIDHTDFIKYDPNGNLVWTARFGGHPTGGLEGPDIAVDSSNNVYVVGGDWETEGTAYVKKYLYFDDAQTPIDLVAFDAEAEESAVLLTWETATERDMAGFHLLRSRVENGGYERVTDVLIAAQGDGFTGATYEFVDDSVDEGTYYYKLEAIDLTGASEFFGPVDVIVAAEPEFGCGTADSRMNAVMLVVMAAIGMLLWSRRRYPQT